MHDFLRCDEPGCGSLRFHLSATCLAHHPDPAAAAQAAREMLASPEGAKDLSAAGLSVEDIDLSRRRFVGCSFIGASFKKVLFTGSTFLLCFFDKACIEDSDLSGVNAQFCSFGSARIGNVSFENSELIHCSFDGSRLIDATFNGSNLYDSRFIRAEIESSDFENCDLKRVYYLPTKQSSVSFKGSNTMEAIRDLEHLYL